MPQLITDVKLVQYSPPPTDEVAVVATIGNGQLGGWAILLDGQFIQGGNTPARVVLGTGSELVGRTLEVSASITDVQGATDRMSLRVEVTGLPGPIDIEHVGPPGGRAAYSILVQFGG